MKHIFSTIILASFLSFLLISSCKEKKSKPPIAIYIVDAVTNKDYEIEGTDLKKSENPSLTLKRGETYEFIVNAYDHPFYIKTEKVEGKNKAYNKGVSNNGAQDGAKLIFSVPMDAPDVLYYVCRYHKMMAGELNIID